MDLQDARSVSDLAEVFKCPSGHLIYYLYRLDIPSQYTTFPISKKSGGVRMISSPHTNLRLIQKNIVKNLKDIRSIRDQVHGFIDGRSIITNAQSHVKARYIINIDLKDFYPSINFGRVYGMLTKKPFNLSHRVAVAIARATTLKDQLPQGACTSPLISNLICAKLDAEFNRLARTHRWKYTRYADDITLSTYSNNIEPLLITEYLDSLPRLNISPLISEIVKNNGFEINSAKTRVASRKSRQEVTGLIVNNKVNIDRRYIRGVRGTLHAIEKHGLDNAQTIYETKYKGRGSKEILESLQGKISFIRQVRGVSDPLYRKLAIKFNSLSPKKINLEPTQIEKAKLATWIIEGDDQGTCFLIKNVGFITSSHCLGKNQDTLEVYSSVDPSKRYSVKVIADDPSKDVAILSTPLALKDYPYQLALSRAVAADDSDVILMGYPKYAIGHNIRLEKGKLLRSLYHMKIKCYEITPKIIEGNSGGPVLNSKYEVVGIAYKGINGDTAEQDAVFLSVRADEIPEGIVQDFI